MEMEMENHQIVYPGGGSISNSVAAAQYSFPPNMANFHGSESFDGSENNKEKPGGKKEGGSGGQKKVRKHRFAFQTRSHVDILDDGYRWRKYGQKAVKNNKFPRSYYRCTFKDCNVKKQVQRLSKDEEIVVTTYEGIHTHPVEKPTDNFEHILIRQMQSYYPLS